MNLQLWRINGRRAAEDTAAEEVNAISGGQIDGGIIGVIVLVGDTRQAQEAGRQVVQRPSLVGVQGAVRIEDFVQKDVVRGENAPTSGDEPQLHGAITLA